MISLKRLGTLVKGSSQAINCFATLRLPVEHYKNWTRHQPFDHINSCRGQLILDKPNSNSPGQVTFWRTHAATRKRASPTKMRNTYNATPEPGYIVRQSLRSFISNSWPRGGRLPEREPSQLVLDQVLLWTCKHCPIYTQLQPITLQFWLTYIRCLGDGCKSEQDWWMLSLGVSGHVYFVIFVYQSRLSVDSAGRIRFWRSSQFLVSGFP